MCGGGEVELVNSKLAWFATSDLTVPSRAGGAPASVSASLPCSQVSGEARMFSDVSSGKAPFQTLMFLVISFIP